MDIVHVRSHKKAWLPLLLVGDESEAMIDRYLECGELFVLHDPDARGLCVVTREGEKSHRRWHFTGPAVLCPLTASLTSLPATIPSPSRKRAYSCVIWCTCGAGCLPGDRQGAWDRIRTQRASFF